MKIVSLLISLLAAAQTWAIEILPTSYTFDQPTGTGSYNYSDWGGTQLTDGNYGSNIWSANLGNGPAYEWVGWVNKPVVNIDFVFGSPHIINRIDIGTVQDHIFDVVIPNAFIYSSSNGIDWSLQGLMFNPESPANNNLHKTLSFTGLNISDNQVRVSLQHSYDGPWTFADEIDFFSSSAVPDSSSTAVLAILSILSLAVVRRRLQ